MRRLRLTDAELRALAAGRPTPGALGQLRKAQLSRHLVLLSEILRAETPPWYATSPSRRILADPATGLYAATAVAMIRSGAPPPDRPALVDPAARTLVASCDGFTLRVRLDDADPLRDRLGLTPTGRLDTAQVAHWQRTLDDALRLLVRRHPADAAILAEVLRVIIPVEPDPAAGGISASSAHAYGAVAMSAPADGPALAVGLLHETAHSLLNATLLLFDLLASSPAAGPAGPAAGPALGYSPWRDDPRPALGVLHGAYAYLAVARFRRAEAAAGSRLAAFEFARWRSAVVAAAESLLSGTHLMPDAAPVDDGFEVVTPPCSTAPHPVTGAGSVAQAAVDNEAETVAPPCSTGPHPVTGAGSAAQAAVDNEAETVAPPCSTGPHPLTGVGTVAERGTGGQLGLLTAAGRRFVAALRDEAAAWLDEPVDPKVARLAADVNTDHRVRWRLRNLRVDPAGVARLVAAWRSAAARPDLPEVVVEAAPRRLETSARLDRVHAMLRATDGAAVHRAPESSVDDASGTHRAVEAGATEQSGTHRAVEAGGLGGGGSARGDQRRPAGGRLRPGDDAWLRGDHGTARDAYRKELESGGAADAGVDAALAGLALVSRRRVLRERPEVVRAVWLAAGRPSLDGLLDWLGP